VFRNKHIRQFDVDHPFPDELKLVLELTYATSSGSYKCLKEGPTRLYVDNYATFLAGGGNFS